MRFCSCHTMTKFNINLTFRWAKKNKKKERKTPETKGDFCTHKKTTKQNRTKQNNVAGLQTKHWSSCLIQSIVFCFCQNNIHPLWRQGYNFCTKSIWFMTVLIITFVSIVFRVILTSSIVVRFWWDVILRDNVYAPVKREYANENVISGKMQ